MTFQQVPLANETNLYSKIHLETSEVLFFGNAFRNDFETVIFYTEFIKSIRR